MITPHSEAELSEAVRAADGALRISGGGTRGFAVPGTPLSVARMSGITLYEPGALTLVAQAGTPVADVEAALAAERQRLAFEPMDHRLLLGTQGTPTLGGIIAANVSGPRRIQGGAARDYALGVRFVDGAGAIVKNGGRVMKNVTGYDLVKLMCGAYGTLGVLSEVSLKVLPVPETTGVLHLHGLGVADAVAAMSKAMGSPFEVTGAAHLPNGPTGDPVTMIRIEGFEASVSYRCAKLGKLLAPFGDATVDQGSDSILADWKRVRDVEMFANRPGDVWRISCKPSDAPDLIARAEADDVLLDWAGGLIWALVPEATDLRARLGVFDGHATLVRADEATRTRLGVFQPESPGVARLSAGLRARFDPRGILNPGLMGPAAKEVA